MKVEITWHVNGVTEDGTRRTEIDLEDFQGCKTVVNVMRRLVDIIDDDFQRKIDWGLEQPLDDYAREIMQKLNEQRAKDPGNRL